MQTALDVAGMIPVIGEPFDAANAGISAVRGDYLSAGLSIAAMIPGAGTEVTAAKLITKYGDEVLAAANAL